MHWNSISNSDQKPWKTSCFIEKNIIRLTDNQKAISSYISSALRKEQKSSPLLCFRSPCFSSRHCPIAPELRPVSNGALHCFEKEAKVLQELCKTFPMSKKRARHNFQTKILGLEISPLCSWLALTSIFSTYKWNDAKPKGLKSLTTYGIAPVSFIDYVHSIFPASSFWFERWKVCTFYAKMKHLKHFFALSTPIQGSWAKRVIYVAFWKAGNVQDVWDLFHDIGVPLKQMSLLFSNKEKVKTWQRSEKKSNLQVRTKNQLSQILLVLAWFLPYIKRQKFRLAVGSHTTSLKKHMWCKEFVDQVFSKGSYMCKKLK